MPIPQRLLHAHRADHVPGRRQRQLQGSQFADTINLEAGDDYVQGYAGNDTVDGGLGNDTLYGNDGNDTLRVAIGNDT